MYLRTPLVESHPPLRQISSLPSFDWTPSSLGHSSPDTSSPHTLAVPQYLLVGLKYIFGLVSMTLMVST
jgi:hypothetical protein